jgi:hypothetical protein
MYWIIFYIEGIVSRDFEAILISLYSSHISTPTEHVHVFFKNWFSFRMLKFLTVPVSASLFGSVRSHVLSAPWRNPPILVTPKGIVKPWIDCASEGTNNCIYSIVLQFKAVFHNFSSDNHTRTTNANNFICLFENIFPEILKQ